MQTISTKILACLVHLMLLMILLPWAPDIHAQTILAQSDDPLISCNGDDCEYSKHLPGGFYSEVFEAYPDSVSGNREWHRLSAAMGQGQKAYIIFPVTDLPADAVIFDAKLTYQVRSTGNNTPIALSPVISPYNTANTNWNSQPTTTLSNTVYGQYSYNGDEINFDLTNIVEGWHENPGTNIGLSLFAAGEGESETTLYSSDADQTLRPVLEILYTTSPQYNENGFIEYTHSRSEADEIFQGLQLATVPHGILMERGLQNYECALYDGVGGDDRPGDASIWNTVLKILLDGVVSQSVTLPHYNAISGQLASDATQDNEVPLMVIDHGFSRLDPQAINRGLIEIQDQKLIELPHDPAESPYIEEQAFLFSSFMPVVITSATNEVIYHLPSLAYIRENEDERLEIDFGDGFYQEIGADQTFTVNYASSGVKTLRMRKVTTSGTVLRNATHQIEVMLSGSDQFSVDSSNPELWQVLSAGGEVAATVTIEYGQHHCEGGDQELVRPFIVVEGFDIFDDAGAAEYWDKFSVKRDAEGESEDWLLERMHQSGFDMMIVDLRTNWSPIQVNSAMLQALIRKVNEEKTSTFGNNIIGFSMGGLIARHALTTLEQDGYDHETDNYFSYDSPHQGAYFPLGALQFMKAIINDVRIPVLNYRLLERAPVIGRLNSAYDSYAATQMAVVQALYEDEEPAPGSLLGGLVSPERINFYEELRALGMPTRARNFAISNGARDGKKQQASNSFGQRYDLSPGDEILNVDVNFRVIRIQASIRALPEFGTEGTTLDYSWESDILRVLFPEYAGLLEPIRIKEMLYTTDGRLYPYENVPGGYIDFTRQMSSNFFANIPFISMVENYGRDFQSFVPLASALNLSNQDFGAATGYQSANMLQAYGSDEELAAISSFDEVITDQTGGSPDNHEHIEGVSLPIARFIYDKITNVEIDGTSHLVDVNWTNMDAIDQEPLWFQSPDSTFNRKIASEFWNEDLSEVYEAVIGDPDGLPVNYYIRYHAESRLFLLGNLCEEKLYGFFFDKQNHIGSEGEVDYLPAIRHLKKYLGIQPGPNEIDDVVFSNGATPVSVEGQTTTLVGIFDNDTRDANLHFGNYKNHHYRGKPNGFNLLNVTNATFSRHGDNATAFHEVNKPWLDSAIRRGDIIQGISDRNVKSNIYFQGGISGREAEDMRFYGKEVDFLEENGYRYTSGTYFVPLIDENYCEMPAYHVMDFSVPEEGAERRHDLRESPDDEQLTFLETIRNDCDLLDEGNLSVLTARVTTKEPGQNYEFQLVSTDREDDGGIPDCNNYQYISANEITNRHYTLLGNDGCTVDPGSTAPVKMLEYLYGELTDLSNDSINFCGEVSIISEGIYCTATHSMINRFRETFPEIRVREFDADLALLRPRRPLNLSYSDLRFDQVSLTWDDRSDNESEFRIYSIAPDGSRTLLQTVAADVNFTTINFLTPETTYQLVVVAANSNGESADSNPVEFTTPAGVPWTVNLFGGNYDLARQGVSLSWGAVKPPLIEQFIIYKRLAGETAWIEAGRQNAGEGYLIDGFISILQALQDRTYEIMVKAANHYGESQPSNIVTVTVPFRVESNPVLSLELINTGDNYAKFQWVFDPGVPRVNPSDPGKYILKGRFSDVPYDHLSINHDVRPGVNEIDAQNLLPGVTYFFRLHTTDYSPQIVSNEVRITMPCETPVGLRVENISDREATVRWHEIAGSGSYRVRYKPVNSDDWKYATAGGLEARLSSLKPDTKYDAEVQAICPAGSAWSGFSDGITFTTNCHVPRDIILTGATASSLSFRWQGDESVSLYEVILRQMYDHSFIRHQQTGNTFLEVGDLLPGTQYRLQMRSQCVNSGQWSTWAQKVFYTECGGPSWVKAENITETKANLRWEPIPGISSYRIRYGKASDTNLNERVHPGNVTSMSIDNLPPGEKMIAKVEGFCNGTGTYAQEVKVLFETLCPPPDNIGGHLAGYDLDIWWNQAQNASKYNILYRKDDATAWEETGAFASQGNRYTLSGLEGNSTYEIEMAAYCPGTGNWSPRSNQGLTFTTPLAVPDAPSGLVIQQTGPTDASLFWIDNSNNETGFLVQARPKGPGFEWTHLEESFDENTTSAVIEGLYSCTEYEFRVKAVNESLSSEYSNTAETTTLPGTTEFFEPSTTHNSITMDWEAVPGMSTYRVSLYIGNIPFHIGRQEVTGTSATFNGLFPVTNYRLKIERECQGQYVSLYDVVSVNTDCVPPPGNLTLLSTSQTSAEIRWDFFDLDQLGLISTTELFEIELCKASSPDECVMILDVDLPSLIPLPQFRYKANLTNLEPGTEYTARVRSRLACVLTQTGWSEPLSFTTDCGLPSDLEVTDIRYNEATVHWDPQTSATQSGVYYKPIAPAVLSTISDSSGYQAAAVINDDLGDWIEASSDATSPYILTGLDPDQDYIVVVRDLCQGEWTPFTGGVTFRTGAICQVPDGLYTVRENSYTFLRWNEQEETESYLVQYRETGESQWAAMEQTTGTNEFRFDHEACKIYEFRVQGNCTSGYITDWSEAEEFDSIDHTCPPGEPENVTFSIDHLAETAKLRWEKPLSGKPVTEYKVFFNGGSQPDTVLSAGTLSYTKSLAGNCAITSMKVVAANSFGETSSLVFTNTLLCAPSEVNAEATGNKKVRVSWADNATYGEVFRVFNAATDSLLAEVPETQTSTMLLLPCDQGYKFYVRKYADGGIVSKPSANSGLTYNPCEPSGPPQNVSMSIDHQAETALLTWTAPVSGTSPAGYRIYLNNAATPVKTVDASIRSYIANIAGNCGVTSMKVESFNQYGESTSPAVQGTLLCSPVGVTAISITGKKVRVTWTDRSSGEDGFRVYDAAGSTILETTGPEVTSVDIPLPCDANYKLMVRSFRGGTESRNSNISTTVWNPCEIPPGVPQNVNMSVDQQAETAKLTWSAPTGGKVPQGYRIYLNGAALPVNLDPSERSYVASIAGSCGENSMRVASFNEHGETLSPKVYGTLQCSPLYVSAVSVAGQQVRVSWTSRSPNTEGFRVFNAANNSLLKTVVNGFTSVDIPLACGKSYKFYVRSFKGSIESRNSNISANVYNPCEIPPGAPQNTKMKIDQISETATISWTPPVNGGQVSGYKVFMNNTLIKTLSASARNHSRNISGLCGNTSMRVEAYNSYGSSASVTYNKTLLCSPINVSGYSVANEKIFLKWTDRSANEDGFYIYNASTNNIVRHVGKNVTSTTFNAACNQSHRYYVRALRNGGAQSRNSNTSTYIYNPCEPPATPSNVTASAHNNGYVTVSWRDNSLGEDGFRIYDASTGAYLGYTTQGLTSKTLSLGCNRYYKFYVIAYKGSVSSPPSFTSNTVFNYCPQPCYITVSNQTKHTATAKWCQLTGASYLYVQYWRADGQGGITTKPVHPTARSYYLSGLTPSTVYYVKIYSNFGTHAQTSFATANGAFRTEMPVVDTPGENSSDVSASPLSGLQFTLYPNPVNDEFNLKFNLRKPSKVSSAIYHLSGKQVRVKEEGILQSGAQELTYTTEGLSSGLYYYQLKIDGEVVANEKLIIKKE